MQDEETIRRIMKSKNIPRKDAIQVAMNVGVIDEEIAKLLLEGLYNPKKHKIIVNTPETIIVPNIVAPIIPVEEALKLFERFNNLKSKALKDKDFLFIGSDGRPTTKAQAKKNYICKSGWRKMGVYFNLDGQILSKEKIFSKDAHGDYYVWLYHVRVTAPNGRYVEAEGVCSSRDPFFAKRKGEFIDPNEANIILKAQTVAYNRAISDMVGGGELSAEEFQSGAKHE